MDVFGGIMSESREEEIRRRIEKRYANRTEFFSHLASFVVLNGLLWFVLLDWRNPTGSLWGVLGVAFTVLWLVGMISHGIAFITFEMREREIQREIERDRAYREAGLRLLELSDDGEIIEVRDKQKRGRDQRYENAR